MDGSSPRRVPWLAVLALVTAGAAAGFLLLEQRLAAGAAALAATAFVAAADVRGVSPRERFGAAVTARVADAFILGALAWVSIPEDPVLAGAAIAAMGTAYLAAYVRSKAIGLGFRLDLLFPRDGLHFLIVAVGLLAGGAVLQVALWVAVGASLVSVARDAGRVAEQPEPR